ncbi:MULTISPECIES: hypothetical protein [Gordonibacter]|uniref:Uncharacterized protein n=1 Tax=Gordonibacter faecis TaxID=3047475 RepID=A0ABT7DK05_9ACTN|nr:hypothetical protein [Gordonibacter sp. KGMB12511]MDJ1649856.1 hypothetical protein [Gordonibacter sp. KGMB12511]
MQGKNKLMVAAAIGMVAVVVAATAVRCSAERAAEEAVPPEPARAEQATAPEEGAEQPSEGGAAEAAASETLSILRGTAWTAPDGSGGTIAFRDGSFVESDGESASVAAFEVVGAGGSEGQRYLDVEIVRDGSGGALSTTIVVDEAEGGATVTSDGFALSGSYVEGAAPESALRVVGVADPYPALVDGRTGELEEAIAEWARRCAPTATEASFDGEVFIDVEGGRVSATFHLDDAASTIVTAIYQGGSFSVVG